MFEMLDNIYIWVFLAKIESAPLLAFFCQIYVVAIVVKTILALWRKIVQNLLISMYLFCPKTVQFILEKLP